MALKPGGPPLPGDGSGDRHMPGGRRPLGPANGGVTEDWGKVILRIKEDLSARHSLALLGSARLGSARLGTVRLGSVRLGSAWLCSVLFAPTTRSGSL